MDEKLWAGVDLKLEYAEFHFDMMWQSIQTPERTLINVALQASNAITNSGWPRAFVYLDAFLSAARSVPEIIQCCFGADLGHRDMREWLETLSDDEQDRRHDFGKKFDPHHAGFRALPLSRARNISEHRGVPPVTATIDGRFGVTYVGSPTEPIPLSETRQIDDPDLALLLAKPHPIQPKWEDFDIEGQPLFPVCRGYLDHARDLVKKGRSIALQVHGARGLSPPPTAIGLP
jgi:hypothetical protein